MLGKVSVRARAIRGVLGFEPVARGKRDDRHGGVIAAHPPQIVDAVPGLQRQVEVDQRYIAGGVRQLFEQRPGRGFPMYELKARAALEVGAHSQRHHGVVVQDGNPDDRGRA
ncbi:hypothetical protein D3C72_1572890 [compost metagenome]